MGTVGGCRGPFRVAEKSVNLGALRGLLETNRGCGVVTCSSRVAMRDYIIYIARYTSIGSQELLGEGGAARGHRGCEGKKGPWWTTGDRKAPQGATRGHEGPQGATRRCGRLWGLRGITDGHWGLKGASDFYDVSPLYCNDQWHYSCHLTIPIILILYCLGLDQA
jgi:hypothetical protein